MRRVIAVVVLFACAATILIAVVAARSFLVNPFAGFDGNEEFVGLSGTAAKRRLERAWPSDVDPAFVRSVNSKIQWSRDSHSSWYRIELTKDAAEKWMDHIHAEEERYSKGRRHDFPEGLEGVHRSVNGPPPMHQQTGESPAWWSPPAIEFRATEVMMWYSDYDSGVGRATYSGFDESTDTLWVYEYACQHDQLWSRGKPPQGVPIRMATK